ncbi:hypothetical protein ACJX0J_024471 [Zea mays]
MCAWALQDEAQEGFDGLMICFETSNNNWANEYGINIYGIGVIIFFFQKIAMEFDPRYIIDCFIFVVIFILRIIFVVIFILGFMFCSMLPLTWKFMFDVKFLQRAHLICPDSKNSYDCVSWHITCYKVNGGT